MYKISYFKPTLTYSKVWILVWFLFYGPSTRFRSFRARSVTLTTLFLGRPPRQFTSAHSFASNWQLLFLNHRKRKNGRRHLFYDQVTTKECAGRGNRTRGRLHAKRTRFRSSYRARPVFKRKKKKSLVWDKGAVLRCTSPLSSSSPQFATKILGLK